jgi:hypothetical protein
MKTPGIVGLYSACYDALFMLMKGAGDQAIAYNGFAWYAGGDAAVREGAVPVVTLKSDATDRRIVTAVFTNVLATVEQDEMTAQLYRAGGEFSVTLLDPTGTLIEIRPPRAPYEHPDADV